MNIKDIIKELEKLGYKVEYRKRTDGGYIIKSINNMTFSGAKGNQYARQVLGVELSQARIEQTSFNVSKYIQNQKKKDTLEPEMKRKLKKVQREWRKKQVKATLSAKKVKRHIKENGAEEAAEYLDKMSRYGQGLAYEDNVEWLAKYYEDLAKGASLTDDDLEGALYEMANYIRSKVADFKEEWINKMYRAGYDILHAIQHGDSNLARRLLADAYDIMI